MPAGAHLYEARGQARDAVDPAVRSGSVEAVPRVAQLRVDLLVCAGTREVAELDDHLDAMLPAAVL